jgi:hypothetical protein
MQQMQAALQHAQQQLADAQRDKSGENKKLELEAFKAATDRLKALGLTLTPEAAAAMGMQTAQSAAQALAVPEGSGGAAAPQMGPPPAMPMQQPMPAPEMQPQPQFQPQPAMPGTPQE